MSIAQIAAKAMLSDALLQGGPALDRLSHLELELPLDKVIKFVSVGLPLMLVGMAFTREISLGEQLCLFETMICSVFQLHCGAVFPSILYKSPAKLHFVELVIRSNSIQM